METIRVVLRRLKVAAEVLLGKAYIIKNSADVNNENTDYFCPVCVSRVNTFLPLPDYYHQNLDRYGYIHSPYLSETLNRFAYQCPKCGASDRSRLYALYLKDHQAESARFLDIAPASNLATFIKKLPWVGEYRSADFEMDTVDDIIDITNMESYADASFDFFLCSHVLEHVEADEQAMAELYRILKPGGKGIAMVPINLGLNQDYENQQLKSPEERWKHFGQNDHVRVYSKPGFIAKLNNAGFAVHQLDSVDFGIDNFERHGIHKHSVLYVVEK